MKKNLFIWILLLCVYAMPACYAQYDDAYDKSNNDNILKDFSALRKKVKKNPKDVAALNSLGIIYARTGKLDEAIKLWNYAIGINPHYVHLYNNLGSAFKQQKKYDKARLIFQTGLLYSQSYWIYYNLGLLEREDGNIIASIEALKKCLAINPDFQLARNQLANFGYYLDAGIISPYQVSQAGIKQPVRFYGTTNGFSKSYGKKKQTNAIPKISKKLSVEDCIEILNKIETSPENKYVVLTFDDGPHRTNTPELLQILKQEGAKATFFVVGSRAETYPDILTQIVAEGHEIGNHTWNHSSLVKISSEQGENTINKTNEIICGITGKSCCIVRPPYGASNKSVRSMFGKHGWHEIMWDVDTRDWENKDPDTIVWRIMKSFSPGSIILMHDIHPYSKIAMSTVLKAFKACGYSFLTVSEMINRTHKHEIAAKSNINDNMAAAQ